MKRVFVMLIAGTIVSGVAAYLATQQVEAKDIVPGATPAPTAQPR